MTREEPEEHVADNDPTAWFEPLYAAAADGRATVPWDRQAPHWSLVRWTQGREVDGRGRRAIVVGCGTGDDAWHVATLGYDVTAFDISPSGIRAAQARYPDSNVDFEVADLFALPVAWRDAFDLVVENQTVQALPRSHRERAIAAVASLAAPGGTVLVLAAMETGTGTSNSGPPWPLTRAEVERFANSGLTPVSIEEVTHPDQPGVRRWSAEFQRP